MSDVVIWSADLEDIASIEARLGQSGHSIKRIKLDRVGLTAMGLRAIAHFQEQGYEVFADAKLIEVPHKVAALTRSHLVYRPWMLNIMAGSASTGSMSAFDAKAQDALKQFADMCHEVGTLPCAVTVLTSKKPSLVGKEFNGRTPIDQVLYYMDLLVRAGFTDAVCSAEEVAAIRSDSSFDRINLNTPGIRMPGTDPTDQARVSTPVVALRVGANRLVIGTNLTEGDFAANCQSLHAHLQPYLATT